jgi:Flp pilus assembly pilin Flp
MTRGNAISEYALPLLLIVVVIVATLTKTGLVDRLLGVFSGSVNDWSGGGQITSVAALGSPVLPLAAAQMPRMFLVTRIQPVAWAMTVLMPFPICWMRFAKN